MAKKVTFDEQDRIMEINTVFCERCDKEYRPTQSTADHPEQYCSQACEVADVEDSEESGDLDLENGKR